MAHGTPVSIRSVRLEAYRNRWRDLIQEAGQKFFRIIKRYCSVLVLPSQLFRSTVAKLTFWPEPMIISPILPRKAPPFWGPDTFCRLDSRHLVIWFMDSPPAWC